MEQVRQNPRPRASSHPNNPEEWDITEDGFRFTKGDRLYNYYDGEWVIVLEDPTTTEWFDTLRDDGHRGAILNSVRVASRNPAESR